MSAQLEPWGGSESFSLDPVQFHAIGSLVRQEAGIDLQPGKESLVRTRLQSRLRALGLSGFDGYLDHIREDGSGAELSRMVDLLTTNKTSFFREPDHFRLLQDDLLPKLAARSGPIRIWSAGCSTGEEAYSLAIVAREVLGADAWRSSILATDISTRVLLHARAGAYADDRLSGVPAPLVSRHFVTEHADGRARYRIAPATRALVRFVRLNLVGPWPPIGLFDLIVCRNVMFYFDRATRLRLVDRFSRQLTSGGHLFVGHSESLRVLRPEMQYVQPSVYTK